MFSRLRRRACSSKLCESRRFPIMQSNPTEAADGSDYPCSCTCEHCAHSHLSLRFCRSSVALPRHNHPLQPQLPIFAPRAGVKHGDAKATPAIASIAAQPKLQIEDERIRRHPMPPLQVAGLPLLCRVSLRLNCLCKTCARKRGAEMAEKRD